MEGTLSWSYASSFCFPNPSHHTRWGRIFGPRAFDSIAGASTGTDRTPKLHSGTPSNTADGSPVCGPPNSRKRTHKVNTEVSPHRAVSAVRLLRIEQGGAFADLLSDKGRKALKNEMDYVERTLGFRTRDLEDRDVRLVPHKLSMYLDDFVRLQTGMQAIIQAGLLKQGLCSVQDESAGLVVSVVDPLPGETIIDCCAAPGGKAVFMASRLRSQGRIWAVDINKARLRVLKEASQIHNVDTVITAIHADLRLFCLNHLMKADKVLLDAPCSGLGVLSKRADLRWNRRLEDLGQLKQLQDELLDSASRLVKPGGILVYSTCSIDPEENEERVAAFLLRHREFAVDPVHRFVPAGFASANGFYNSDPVKHSMDGSFAARLIRSVSNSI